ncbi:MAG: elongation factor P [Desulfohalobiaceae bacterium]|nr:elongation factor P [Desulfohalobiaceae bacterium]
MYSTSDIKNGLKIELDGQPFEVLDFLHSKSGRGGAHIKTKLKNLINGAVLDRTFRSGEKIARPDLEAKDMQYLYKESDKFVFMDMTTYEQVFVDQSALGPKGAFLQEGQEIKVLMFKEQVIDVQLPAAVIMEVAETEPGVKGDTVSGTTKPAIMENGLTVNVPLFINQGERIKVDTRSGEYLGRE